jgi:hypothetical protein
MYRVHMVNPDIFECSIEKRFQLNPSYCFASSEQMYPIIKNNVYKNILDVFWPPTGIGGHLRQWMAILSNSEMRLMTKTVFGPLGLQISTRGLTKSAVLRDSQTN